MSKFPENWSVRRDDNRLILSPPKGQAVIVRTSGIGRSHHEQLLVELAEGLLASPSNDETEANARRYQYIRDNQVWLRREGRSFIGAMFDYHDDFQAKPMLDYHIDRRLKGDSDHE